MNAPQHLPCEQDLASIVDRNFEAALDALHIKRTTYSPQKVAWAKDYILRNFRAILKKKKPNPKSDLFAFARKGVENRLWLSDYGVTKKKFQRILIRNPYLILVSNPETLKMNFEDGVDFLSTFGKKEAALKSLTDLPPIWGMKNGTLRERFEHSAAWMAQRNVTKEACGKAVLKNIAWLRKPPQDLYDRYTGFEKVLTTYGATPEVAMEVALKHPDVLDYTPEKIGSNIQAVTKEFSKLGLTEEKWCAVCVLAPNLFYKKSETTISNIKALIQILEPHGPSHKECLKEILKQPSNLYGDPLKLKKTYELIRILTQIPAFSAATGEKPRKGRSMTAPVKHPAFERFYCLSWSEDNLLLRAVSAELLPNETKLTQLFSASRKKAEETFVKLLGHAPDQKDILVNISSSKIVTAHATVGKTLKNELHQHANELRRAWKENLGLTEDKRKPIKTNVLGVLMPHVTAQTLSDAEKQTLLERAVLSGLVKGYKLVAKP